MTRENCNKADNICTQCNGNGEIEIIGDGEHFECDVIDVVVCRDCRGTGFAGLDNGGVLCPVR